MLLKRALIAAGAGVVYPVIRVRPALARVMPADSVENNLAGEWMARAEEMKRVAMNAGDQPYGAVVVKDDRIIGEGPSRVITRHDPTAHAEMEAIRDASRRLGTGDLSGCILYATSRPCHMCETAAYWAHVSRFIYGSGILDGGAPSYPSC